MWQFPVNLVASRELQNITRRADTGYQHLIIICSHILIPGILSVLLPRFISYLTSCFNDYSFLLFYGALFKAHFDCRFLLEGYITKDEQTKVLIIIV